MTLTAFEIATRPTHTTRCITCGAYIQTRANHRLYCDDCRAERHAVKACKDYYRRVHSGADKPDFLSPCNYCEHLALCNQRVRGTAEDGLRSVVCENESKGEERVSNPQPDTIWIERQRSKRAKRERMRT